MDNPSSTQEKQNLLQQRYRELIEEAYNYSQLDSSISEISEYKAFKILDKLNELQSLN